MKHIRFYLNKDLDKYVAFQFLHEKAAGVDFGEKIQKDHPYLTIARKTKDALGKKRIVNAYFDVFYKKHRQELEKKLSLVRTMWRDKEKDFFDTTEALFDGFEFREGMYIAYLSIIDCNPRFLDSKTFQWFYQKNIEETVFTIAHELLHFIFFDFANKKLKKEITKISEERLWNLSEIFNAVVLKAEIYKNIINPKYVIPYPEHKKYLHTFEKKLKNVKDMREFIMWGIQTLK